MAGFKLAGFRGTRPRLSARLLEPGEAQTAHEVRLGSGDLEALNNPTTLTALGFSSPETLYYYAPDAQWLQWRVDVDVARSPLAGDTLKRLYFTGAPDSAGAETTPGRPKYTWQGETGSGSQATQPPRTWRYLGVPAPTVAPTVTPPAAQPPTTRVISGITITELRMTLAYVAGEYSGTPTSSYLTLDTQGTDPSMYYSIDWVANETQLLVTEIVDTNTVRVADYARSGYVFGTDQGNSNGSRWSRTVSGGTQRGVAKFRCADGQAKLTITSHGLKVGDVLKITSFVTNYTPRVRFNDAAQVHNVTGDIPWGAPDTTVQSGTTYYTHNDKKVWANNTGTTAFTIDGSYNCIVDSTASDTALEDIEARAYVYTYVNSTTYEEGPPSPASSVITCRDGDTVQVSGFGTAASPFTSNVGSYRIYRTLSGSDSTDYYYVGTLGTIGGTFVDTVRNDTLGDVLASDEFEPPDPTLKGLVALANGALAGFVGSVVWLSEPNQPHAWPYKKYIDADIVALAPLGDSLLVLTVRGPYIIAGAHPRSMLPRRLEVDQPCVSKRSVAVFGDGVLYASQDGLVWVRQSGFSIVTEPYLTKREWRNYYPSSLRGAVFDGLYYGFYDNGGGTRGTIVIDPADPTAGLTTSAVYSRAPVYVPEVDELVFADTANVDIRKWNAWTGTARTYTWRSGVLAAPYPMNPSALRVVADSYPVTVNVYADGVLKATRSPANADAVRLPGGYLASTFEIEITGTSRVRQVQMAETLAELADG